MRVPAQLKDLLAALMQKARGAVALVSGRSIAQIDVLFSPLVIPAAGLHGLERRDAANATHTSAPQPLIPRAAREFLAAIVDANPGLLLEDKQATLALHFRQAPERESLARHAAAAALKLAGDEVVLLEGKMVLELRPRGRSKSMAIADFMRERPFLGRKPAFIGDDVTDEPGFEFVNGIGGLSVQVGGDGPSRATHRLPDVSAVHAWLESLLATRAAGGGRAR